MFRPKEACGLDDDLNTIQEEDSRQGEATTISWYGSWEIIARQASVVWEEGRLMGSRRRQYDWASSSTGHFSLATQRNYIRDVGPQLRNRPIVQPTRFRMTWSDLD